MKLFAKAAICTSIDMSYGNVTYNWYCPNVKCKSKVEQGASFCPNCGQKLKFEISKVCTNEKDIR